MNFLADENFPGPAIRALRERGLNVHWIIEDSPGASDDEILARCVSDKLTLLTLDKDFGELLFQKGLSANSGVILFRNYSETPEQFTETVVAALQSRDDWTGYFSVITRDRIRMRRLKSRRG